MDKITEHIEEQVKKWINRDANIEFQEGSIPELCDEIIKNIATIRYKYDKDPEEQILQRLEWHDKRLLVDYNLYGPGRQLDKGDEIE